MIVYEIKSWPFYNENGFTLRHSLFGSAKLTKIANSDKNFYFQYDISFNVCETFSLRNGEFGKNVIIFGADTAHLCMLIVKKDILFFRKGPTQGLGDTTLTAKAEYFIDFTEPGKKFCLNLHYNGSNNYLFVNGLKNFQFKPKYSGIN